MTRRTNLFPSGVLMALLPTRATLLVTPLSDLRDWHLVVTCRCRGFPQHIDLAQIAADFGGRLILERVVMKLRCSRCHAAQSGCTPAKAIRSRSAA